MSIGMQNQLVMDGGNKLQLAFIDLLGAPFTVVIQ
jgi:hypothetical protein